MKPTKEILQAMTNLTRNKDWVTIAIWLLNKCKEDALDGRYIKDEVECRWAQGRNQSIMALLKAIESSPEKLQEFESQPPVDESRGMV